MMKDDETCKTLYSDWYGPIAALKTIRKKEDDGETQDSMIVPEEIIETVMKRVRVMVDVNDYCWKRTQYFIVDCQYEKEEWLKNQSERTCIDHYLFE